MLGTAQHSMAQHRFFITNLGTLQRRAHAVGRLAARLARPISMLPCMSRQAHQLVDDDVPRVLEV